VACWVGGEHLAIRIAKRAPYVTARAHHGRKTTALQRLPAEEANSLFAGALIIIFSLTNNGLGRI
jgi:hypothetical protein